MSDYQGILEQEDPELGGIIKRFVNNRDEYLSWEDMALLPKMKIGRNTLCPCGSNKKYKKCCL